MLKVTILSIPSNLPSIEGPKIEEIKGITLVLSYGNIFIKKDWRRIQPWLHCLRIVKSIMHRLVRLPIIIMTISLKKELIRSFRHLMGIRMERSLLIIFLLKTCLKMSFFFWSLFLRKWMSWRQSWTTLNSKELSTPYWRKSTQHQKVISWSKNINQKSPHLSPR